eukprot:COSAG02_NODE_805_length_16972_cov_36.668287_6_plen_173_part_00
MHDAARAPRRRPRAPPAPPPTFERRARWLLLLCSAGEQPRPINVGLSSCWRAVPGCDASGGVSGVMEGSAVKTEEARARKRARAGAQNEGAVAADEPHRPANYVLRYTCEGHDNSLSSLKFSPDGKWLASACEPCPLRRGCFASCALPLDLDFRPVTTAARTDVRVDVASGG